MSLTCRYALVQCVCVYTYDGLKWADGSVIPLQRTIRLELIRSYFIVYTFPIHLNGETLLAEYLRSNGRQLLLCQFCRAVNFGKI